MAGYLATKTPKISTFGDDVYKVWAEDDLFLSVGRKSYLRVRIKDLSGLIDESGERATDVTEVFQSKRIAEQAARFASYISLRGQGGSEYPLCYDYFLLDTTVGDAKEKASVSGLQKCVLDQLDMVDTKSEIFLEIEPSEEQSELLIRGQDSKISVSMTLPPEETVELAEKIKSGNYSGVTVFIEMDLAILGNEQDSVETGGTTSDLKFLTSYTLPTERAFRFVFTAIPKEPSLGLTDIFKANLEPVIEQLNATNYLINQQNKLIGFLGAGIITLGFFMLAIQ